jgi:hypothetical protein
VPLAQRQATRLKPESEALEVLHRDLHEDMDHGAPPSPLILAPLERGGANQRRSASAGRRRGAQVAVVGSIVLFTRVIRLAGKPDSSACLRISVSSLAR